MAKEAPQMKKQYSNAHSAFALMSHEEKSAFAN